MEVPVSYHDLSVAGKQLGIHEGQRSNLFFEAIRIIKEMRNADEARGRSGKSIRPRFAVWENVPGCFSSNKGHDFQAVLQAFCEIGGANRQAMFLCLKKDAGNILGVSWETVTHLPGKSWTVNTAEFLNEEKESTLSQILEVNAPEKYYLSSRACQGILRRAERRGKELPPMLKEALEEAVALGI